MDMKAAIETVVFKKYADFKGRAERTEFWWWTLAIFLANLVLNIVDYSVFRDADTQPISMLFSLAILVPALAVSARRLHDIGRTGWWLLIALIPVLGILVLIYWFIQRGEDGPNIYGQPPMGGSSGPANH